MIFRTHRHFRLHCQSSHPSALLHHQSHKPQTEGNTCKWYASDLLPEIDIWTLTYKGITFKSKEKQEKSIIIYGTRIDKSAIWTRFLASLDLERSLTKTKDELQQASTA